MRRRGWKSCTVCFWSLVGRKNTPWLGQHYSSPQTQSMSWSLNVSGKKWQTRRSGRRWSKKHVCLQWVLLLPVTSIHFFSPWSRKKEEDLFVCLCACMCVTSYPHKRFCILSALFILPFIRTVLFSADHLMSCPGLSCIGKKHHSKLISYGYKVRINI